MRPTSAKARKGATGTCRNRRRRRAGGRQGWVRRYRRAQRVLDSTANQILEAMGMVLAFERSVERRPVRTCRRLTRGLRGLAAAGLKILRAQHELAEAKECLGRVPEHAAGDAAEILELASERCQAANHWLRYALNQVLMRQMEVLAGLACGELVPEHPSDSRPRIVVTPRPVAFRAFLAARQHRVADRITPVLQRRRRTPRPAALSVPPRTSQGRAPPFSSTCAL